MKLSRVLAEFQTHLLVAGFILTLGFTLGFALDANTSIPQPWNRVSSILGWIYFFCWAVGFIPQALLNYSRKGTVGYSLDAAVLGILGFGSYAVFNCAFYFNESVQQAYMARHDGNRNAVEVNDVFFSIYSTSMVALTISQCWVYPSANQTISRATKLTVISTLGVAVAYSVAILLGHEVPFVAVQPSVLDLLYYFSYVKLGSTFIKEVPQLMLNYRRKSTVGWTISGVLLDIPGCMLSITQLLLDSWATNDWSAVTGDPVKLLLAFASLAMDSLFILQHYVWFAESHHDVNEVTPLLPVSTASRADPPLKSPTIWPTYSSDFIVDKGHWEHSKLESNELPQAIAVAA